MLVGVNRCCIVHNASDRNPMYEYLIESPEHMDAATPKNGIGTEEEKRSDYRSSSIPKEKQSTGRGLPLNCNEDNV